MFFVVSKILSFIAQPLAIVAMLFVAGWFIRNQRWKKILLRTSLIGFILFSNLAIANEVMRAWEWPLVTFNSMTKRYDYGVLLTGITKPGLIPKDRTYFGRGADRATHTLHLYKIGIIKKILVSGGSGRLDGGGMREADDLADFLKMAGVPDSALIIENESKNTHESAMRVSKMLSTMDGPKEVLIITSGYHIRRTMACFRKAGVNADPFATDPISEPTHLTPENMLVPKIEAFGMWQILLKEWIGVAAYWVVGYI